MKTITRHITYLLALFQLRSLEISLQGKCDTLPMVDDAATRAVMAISIQRLSLEVVEARNRVLALKPEKQAQRTWSAA